MASEGVGDGSKRKREDVDDAVDGDAADVLATLARAAAGLNDPVKSRAIHHEILDHRKSGGAPRELRN